MLGRPGCPGETLQGERVQKILTAMAAAGMVLAKDVQTEEGRVLCGKGTELDQNLIDRLQRMEISHITVEGHPLKLEGEKSLEQELYDLERRFHKVSNIPPLMYLKKRLQAKLVAARAAAGADDV